jgi:SAM-dependent methyltransferase
MPSLVWNKQHWNSRSHWDFYGDGEQWSEHWGTSASQWLTSIYPRLAPFLPAASVVEIAPGMGRWTQYLLPHCESYLGVDLSELCVTSCQERFAGHRDVRFAVNDGRSLPMVPDRSVDLVFSFDSLVHAESDVMTAYLQELARVLNPRSGVAFLHHSNLARYRGSAPVRDVLHRAAWLLRPARPLLNRCGIFAWHGGRARSESAALFAEQARAAGLAVIGQEVISWKNPLLIDCISVVTPPRSQWDRDPVVAHNRSFHASARSSAAAARVFPAPALPGD